jgi:NodT family efflux transporter outer membrane factor (OMF) lipoprotein
MPIQLSRKPSAKRINPARPRGETMTRRPQLESIARVWTCLVGFALFAILICGCTSAREYVRNGFKVGPNYGRPPAPVANDWIDSNDQRLRKESDDLSKWWTVFNDPALDSLICCAYHQNLTLRQAGFRILEARAQLAIDTGNLLPQTQQMNGSYVRQAISRETAAGSPLAKHFFSQWNYGFNLAWELDFWGRFRRTIESDQASLDASVENYDDVLVTMLSDIATSYTTLRTTEERIKFAKQNVNIQTETLKIVEGRFKAGTTNALDVDQARSTLEQTEAEIPELEIALRLSITQLCILLGIPPEDLRFRIGPASIPTAPPEVAIGIPADLLRRRPDVRRAERQAAAQCAQIGVAESELYPHLSLTGTFNLSAQHLSGLFRTQAFNGSVGPSFSWNILNYGRLVNNVRLQDARFQELIAFYQQAVLLAGQDVENGLITFLNAQQRTKLQAASVDDAEKAVKIALAQYTAGTIDLTRVTLLQQTLVQQQDTLAQAQGEIATGLIQVYKALGGGWQLRLTDCQSNLLTSNVVPPTGPNKAQPPKDAPQSGAPNASPIPKAGATQPGGPKLNFLPEMSSPAKPTLPNTDSAKPVVPELNLVPDAPGNSPKKDDVPKNSSEPDTIWKGVDR